MVMVNTHSVGSWIGHWTQRQTIKLITNQIISLNSKSTKVNNQVKSK